MKSATIGTVNLFPYWTKIKPSMAGLCWYRRSPDHDGEPVEILSVTTSRNGFSVYWPHSGTFRALSKVRGEWSSVNLSLPKEP